MEIPSIIVSRKCILPVNLPDKSLKLPTVFSEIKQCTGHFQRKLYKGWNENQEDVMASCKEKGWKNRDVISLNEYVSSYSY